MTIFLTISYCWTIRIFPTIINNNAKNIFVHLIMFILVDYFFRMHFQKWDYWVKVLAFSKSLIHNV